jgi:hypothetical protein
VRSSIVSTLALLALVGTSGCVDSAPLEPVHGGTTYYLAALQQVDSLAADPPVCLPEPLPAWHEVPRVEGGLVPRGASLVEIDAIVSGVWTGLQVGYRVDDAPFVWSPRIDQGSTSVVVHVLPGQYEEDGPRWTFAWRTQTFGQDCMEGAYSGSLSVAAVAAVP